MLKSIAMTLSNTLIKQGLTRSQALKRAWRMVKQTEFYSKAVGVTYNNRQKALERLLQYNKEQVNIILEHEENVHGNRAVAVKVSVSGSIPFTIGYLSREVAGLWCRLVDRQKVTAKFENVTGGHGKRYGLNFKLQLVA